jgi:sulfite reductase beta subunit-like hemoprotein
MFQIASRAHRRGLAVTVRQLMQLHTVKAVAEVLDPGSDSGLDAAEVSLSSAVPLQRVSRENYRIST